jgi:DNA mismatch endonuclease (patch repair protein)
VDTLTPLERSARMALVRSRDTKPEMRVRRLVHSLGYRYRLHRRDLPGTPDLVFPARRKAIFVHGCFWHRHDCAMGDRLPKSRVRFWSAKIAENIQRDRRNLTKLRRLGWKALIVWECQTRGQALADRIRGFLDAKP